ncbi:vWA domain-containing protein [Ponticaulis profundi]|uniref:VWA domain-containing protein n=1 Tax=Ponticaulis profundi TaxID=2665222 RepID=A0ABW1SEY4_9PROT
MSVERTVTDFVRALRSADVNVSTAETLDAVQTLKLVGYNDRSMLKTSLRHVLAKSEGEKGTYDRLFDLFFSRKSNTPETTSEDEQSDDGEANSDASEDAGPKDLLDLAQSGDESEIAVAMERAADAASVQDIRFSTQVSFYAQKMLKEMGVERMEKQLLDALKDTSGEREGEAQQMIDARRDMTRRAQAYVQQQFDIFGASETQRFREEYLSEKRINDMDRSDIERMKPLVQKLAKRLATKHSRRRKKKNRGQLDIRKTLRRNAGRDGVPFDIAWRETKKDRPKLILICDVSGSVARHVRFLLLFLYCLKDVVPDIYTFAFSARLKDVGSYLDTDLAGFENAMQRIMTEAGWGSTDYGQALSDMKVNHWSLIDRRSTIIVLGDGRSNYGDPRLDLFEEATSRAKRLVWLSPEGKALWGTGDSEMLRYQPHCTTMTHMTSLKDLERAIDDILMHYS